MDLERRQFARVTVLCKVTVILGDRSKIFDAHTENLGAGGMRIILPENLMSNAELEAELYLPDKVKFLKCRGKVTWSKEMTPRGVNPRFFDIGIEFIKMDDADRTTLQGTINALLTQVQRNIL